MEDLKKLLAAATPGPWTHASDKLAAGNIKAPDNAALICAAVNALPGLMAERDRMKEALEKIVTEASYLTDTGWGGFTDGYAAGLIDAAKLARAALGEKP